MKTKMLVDSQISISVPLRDDRYLFSMELHSLLWAQEVVHFLHELVQFTKHNLII